jgi:spore maturation protein CgeB
MNCVFLGLSITSTWGNGHATTYRGLLKELAKRGHSVTFLERDVPWYSSNREFTKATYCKIGLYQSVEELKERYGRIIRNADVVVVGSYVPEGIAVGKWVTSTAKSCTAFYDIDTPVTLANLKRDRCEYLSHELCRKYQTYLSFTGGPTLEFIEHKLGSPCAQALYCSVDPSLYYPESQPIKWDLGYLGTYAADRQPALENLLVDVARRQAGHCFVVGGPQYPGDIEWPANVERTDHLPAREHRKFYNSQKFTLNVTRQDMVRAGYSPSVRLFEAAACGVPIITDKWAGLESFFEPGTEILPVSGSQEVISHLNMPVEQRMEIADRARRRTLRFHSAAARAEEFETHIIASLDKASCSNRRSRAALQQAPSAALI